MVHEAVIMLMDDIGFQEHDDIRFKDYDVLWRRDINVHPCKIRATINQNKYLTFFIGGLLLCFCYCSSRST